VAHGSSPWAAWWVEVVWWLWRHTPTFDPSPQGGGRRLVQCLPSHRAARGIDPGVWCNERRCGGEESGPRVRPVGSAVGGVWEGGCGGISPPLIPPHKGEGDDCYNVSQVTALSAGLTRGSGATSTGVVGRRVAHGSGPWAAPVGGRCSEFAEHTPHPARCPRFPPDKGEGCRLIVQRRGMQSFPSPLWGGIKGGGPRLSQTRSSFLPQQPPP